MLGGSLRFMAARSVWFGAKRVRADYDGLLWTNMSVSRLFLFKQIIANSV